MTKRQLGHALSLVIAGALLLGTEVQADAGWYVGASWGGTRYNHDVHDLSDGSLEGGRVDDSDSGWKLFGGYRWSRHLAVEAGYSLLNGDVDGETTLVGSVSDGSGPRFAEGGVGVDLDEPRSFFAAAIGTLPIGERTGVSAKLGFHSWRTDLSIFDSNGIREEDESGTEPLFGLGVEHRFSKRWAVGIEWDRFMNVVDNDIDLVSLGFTVALGSRQP